MVESAANLAHYYQHTQFFLQLKTTVNETSNSEKKITNCKNISQRNLELCKLNKKPTK